MPHKLMVFDWNGTILSDTKAAWRAGNECLKLYGADPISLEHYRDTFHFPIMHFYKKNGISVDRVLERKDEANTVFLDHYEAAVQMARTRTGARDLLLWLKTHNVTCIILSNYQTNKITAQLKRLKIDHFFHHVSAHNCGGTTILQNTTKVNRLSRWMVKRNYRPQNTVIIGDSAEEPDIARHLGLHSIGITDGCISHTRLKKAEPDYIVHNLRAVKSILAKKWGLPV